MSTFTTVEKLTSPLSPANFGSSVALSSDGDTALIGAPVANGSAGAAWVFIRGGVWTNQEMLSDKSSSDLGISVALSADGNTALVGAPNSNSGVGSATVFTRTGTTWASQQTLLAPTSGADKELGEGFFGASVALSADGNTALVGVPSNNAGVGSAIAFTRKGTAWTNQQTLLAPTSGADKGIGAANFGAGVALSADGSTALVGAPFNNPSGSIAGVGSAIVFTRTATGWIIQQTLRAPTSGTNKELKPGNFGANVALNADGNTALVGAPGDDLTGAFQTGVGAAWVFTREARTWDAGQKLTAPTSGSDEEIASTLWGKGQFGWSVALSSDGNTALIGGQNDNGEVGAAWVFIYQPAFLHRAAGWYVTQKLTAPATGPAKMNGAAHFGCGVALSGDGTTALIGGRLDDVAETGGQAGAAWILTAPPPRPPP